MLSVPLSVHVPRVLTGFCHRVFYGNPYPHFHECSPRYEGKCEDVQMGQCVEDKATRPLCGEQRCGVLIFVELRLRP